jgi:GAF domain-containing protein
LAQGKRRYREFLEMKERVKQDRAAFPHVDDEIAREYYEGREVRAWIAMDRHDASITVLSLTVTVHAVQAGGELDLSHYDEEELQFMNLTADEIENELERRRKEAEEQRQEEEQQHHEETDDNVDGDA